MINLNPAATPAAPAALGGVPDAAAGGDFLAMLAGIVGNVTSAASPDGDGVLLPGSPLLDAAHGTAGNLVADLAAEFGAILDAEVVTDGADAADGEVAGSPWPPVQALAAMLAQPAAAAPAAAAPAAAAEVAAATEPSAGPVTDAAVPAAQVGTGTHSPIPGPAAPAVAGTAGTAGAGATPDSPAALTPADTVASKIAVTPDTPAAPTPATAAATITGAGTDVVAEAAPADQVVTPARTATAPARTGGTTAATAETADATSVADAAADAGEPVRVEAARRNPDAEFRPARTGTADTLADPIHTTGELREAGGTVRDRAPMTSAAAGVARVLDAIEQLEKAPPPRQVTLELGDVRVRLAVEDGAVRMQLLGEHRDAGRDFLRAASEALRERGFEMAGEGGGDARDRDAERQRPDLAPPRPDRGFGRAGRATDPTTTGVRAGIHL